MHSANHVHRPEKNPIFVALWDHNPQRKEFRAKHSERDLLIEALKRAPEIRLYDVGKALGVYL